MLLQGVLRQDPFSGHLFVFGGPEGQTSSRWGTGMAPASASSTKRLEHGVFLWPSNVEPGGTLTLTAAQLSMLIDRIGWRAPQRRWKEAHRFW
jgi:transposase